MTAFRFCLHAALWASCLPPTDLHAVEPIQRRLPPLGIEIPGGIHVLASNRLSKLRSRFEEVKNHPAAADADVLLKAVYFALSQREIYEPEQLGLLDETLSLAEQRLDSLKSGKPDWHHDKLTVRGFYSRIDASPQPYGLVIPRDLPKDKPVSLYVWLHGRGDKTTDIHFIKQRLTKVRAISPPGAIVLHPFGRQCIGFKSAGETDVLEAIEHTRANYNIDTNRIVLMGFSMGGAGAWHLGAHYTDHFVAISPGAGFAETSNYQKYSSEQIAATPGYERQLWGVYDVPNYARNFFNVPLVCYSGEKDKQIQAARVMEDAFRKHGKKLDHVIGPGMGHKYHPDALAEIMSKMDVATKNGRATSPSKIHLQTQTLRYSRMHWIQVDRLQRHWHDSTVDAEVTGDSIRISTQNVAQLTIAPLPTGTRRVVIDGHDLLIHEGEPSVVLSHTATWELGPLERDKPLAKKPALQGPIDDAFLDRFIVVTPTAKSENEHFDAWVEFELGHLRGRWSALFRGTLPEKPDTDISEEDIRTSHLVLFGTHQSNSVLRRIIGQLPLKWDDETLQVASREFSGSQHVPVMIYPNPLNPKKYVVLNSGPTFREAHDRTNSLQNPKLPDWAVLDISIPPNAESAGKVIAADFFDEQWQPKGK